MSHHVVALVVLLGASSCSTSEPELTADSFKEQYPEAYCSHVFRCCDAGERSHGSAVVCQQEVTARVLDLLGFSAAPTPFAKFSAFAAKSCLDRLRQASCDDLSLIEPGCAEDTVQPLHKEGEDCTYSAECESFYCIQPQKLVRGSCGAPEGPHCSGDDRSCRQGHLCLGGECQLRKGNAAPCGGATECESGVCTPTTKTCIPRPTPFCDGK